MLKSRYCSHLPRTNHHPLPSPPSTTEEEDTQETNASPPAAAGSPVSSGEDGETMLNGGNPRADTLVLQDLFSAGYHPAPQERLDESGLDFNHRLDIFKNIVI